MNSKIQDLAYKIGDINGRVGYFPLSVANGLFQKIKNMGSSYPNGSYLNGNNEEGRRHYPRETVHTELGFCSIIQELSSHKDIIKSLDTIKSVNGRWFRTEFPYEGYKDNFEKTDEIVDEAQKRGINVLPVIGSWVTGSPRMPNNMKDYLKYVEDIVGRYAGKIEVYNVWNEPNLFGFWLDSRKNFTHMLKKTHKKMIDTDRNTLASVNFNWQPWRRQVYEFIRMLDKENALKHIDVIGLDSYPGSYELGNAFSWRDKIKGTKECLNSLGHDIEVWVMEYGYYAYPNTKLSSHTPRAQTKFLRDATKVISSEDVPVAIWYCLKDITHFPRTFLRILPQEHNFGILKRDYKPKDPEIFDVIRSLT